ncbi:MAG TPA: efflux RND transporter periplasmic adaptor subunit [Verrucomicrobiae bacterium]|nr:efflux RND transporter periplasmic adaptor subunit [Verrucomicrobiae bacterium]
MKTKDLVIFLIISLVVVGGAGIGAYVWLKPSAPEIPFVTAETHHVQERVRSNGEVKASQDVDLSFERSGRIAHVNATVGQHVKAGDVLLELENSAEAAMVQQARALLAQKQAGATSADIAYAQAAVDAAKADVEKTKADTAASIATAQSAVDTAQNNLKLADGGEDSQIVSQAYDAAATTLQASLPKLDDGLAQADLILGVDNTAANANFKTQLSATDAGKLVTADSLYQEAKIQVAAAHSATDEIGPGANHANVDTAMTAVQTALAKMSALLQAVSDVLNATIPGGNLSASDLSAKQLTIQGERTAVSTQVSAVVAASQAVSNAKNSLTTYTIALQKAQNDLVNVQNSAASLVKLKESAVAQAEANLSSKTQPVREVDLAPLRASLNAAVVAYNKTRLLSPIDGVVSVQDGKVGMIISPNVPVVSVINEGGFQLETLVSETDIAKLAVGNKAEVTLDAYGSDTLFPATVVKLDPAATTENGVTGYKATFQFDQADERIKPGLTANVSVVTQERDAVAVPERSVLEKNGEDSVLVKTANGTETRVVQVGIKGADGWWEITSGLQAGDQVEDFGR